MSLRRSGVLGNLRRSSRNRVVAVSNSSGPPRKTPKKKNQPRHHQPEFEKYIRRMTNCYEGSQYPKQVYITVINCVCNDLTMSYSYFNSVCSCVCMHVSKSTEVNNMFVNFFFLFLIFSGS